MKLIISVINEFLDDDCLKELNNDNVSISCIHQRSLSLSPEVIVFIFSDILKNIGYNALYDLSKQVLLAVINKVQKCTKKDTKITLIHNDDIYHFDFPFELNDEQKDNLVNAAIERMFKDR